MATEALPIRAQAHWGVAAILVALLLASIALSVVLVRSGGGQPGPAAVDVLGPQRIYLVGSNDAAFRKAYPYQHCTYAEEGSRYGSPSCRP
jgi:hypothetical protein